MAFSNLKLDPIRPVLASVALGLSLSANIALSADDGEPPLVPEEKTDASLTRLAAVKEKLHDWGLTGSLRGAYWSSNRRLDDEKHIPNFSRSCD